MNEAAAFFKIAETLGIQTSLALVGFGLAWILWKRNTELQRRLFKLANAQVQAISRLEATLDAILKERRGE